MQGRARPSIATLYNWRYKALGDMPHVSARESFQVPHPTSLPLYSLPLYCIALAREQYRLSALEQFQVPDPTPLPPYSLPT